MPRLQGELPKAFHLAETVRIEPGGWERRPHLPIYVFAVFGGEYVQPLGTGTAVENTMGPNPVGPDLILLKVTFQRGLPLRGRSAR